MTHGPTLRTYTRHKEGWSSYTYDSVAWESFAMAFNKLKSAQQTIMTEKILVFGAQNPNTDVTGSSLKIAAFEELRTKTGYKF
jgi:hypothetical protein